MFETVDISGQRFVVLNSFQDTIEAIADICRQRGSRAWLFGSCARGTAGPSSDIDVAVSGGDFAQIEEDIDSLETIYKIDLVDLAAPHDEGIKNAWISIA